MSKVFALFLSIGISLSSARNGHPVTLLKTVRIDSSLSFKGGEISDVLAPSRVVKVMGANTLLYSLVWLLKPELMLDLLGTEATTETKHLGRYMGVGFGALGALMFKNAGDSFTLKASTALSAALLSLIPIGGMNGCHNTENWFYKLQIAMFPVQLVVHLVTCLKN
mmetsp:Transcript_28751/g.29088  ORF Transcript_28751/g.29088 Transcript_28751/m.29088 type:complete len:166 (+) Transcript_28751:166-663(+)